MKQEIWIKIGCSRVWSQAKNKYYINYYNRSSIIAHVFNVALRAVVTEAGRQAGGRTAGKQEQTELDFHGYGCTPLTLWEHTDWV